MRINKTRRFAVLGLLVGMLVPALGVSARANAAEVALAEGQQSAIFAGGCFWCVESDFDKVPGVLKTISGYTGGQKLNPTYEEVSAGYTGHAEAVQVVFDSKKVSYQQLVEFFWRSIDPTTLNSQFCDHGNQYRTAIFYNSPEQKQIAEQSKAALEKNKPFKERIVTEITQAGPFYPAEEYHQDFHVKSSIRYDFYRYRCGRDQRVKELWGKKAG